MKKLISTLLTLVLLVALTTPALADMGYVPLNTDPEWLAWKEAWIEDNPEAWAAFDPDLWFDQHYEGYPSQKEYMEIGGLTTREEFEAHMAETWLAAIRSWEEALPLAEEYAAAHSEEYAAFDADAWVEQSWYNTREGCMTMWQVDGETFERYMWAEYVRTRSYPLDPQVQAWTAAHPQAAREFHAAIDAYAAKEWGYDSVAQMATDWDTSEEYVRDMLLEQWVFARIAREEAQQEMEQLKKSLGGVPGQLGVMLNGTYITFPDAVPESVDGRVMVPCRALMEALGGDVAYDAANRTVSCLLDGTILTLALGESALTVDENGEISTLEMDCAAYAKDGCTYVPVRFVSQALGCDVLWDQGVETAVVLDRQGAIDEINEQFTVLNRALGALAYNKAQAYESQGNITADLTLFDSIGADETHRFTADSSAVIRGSSRQVSMTMDLSALGEMIDLEYLLAADPYYEITEEERAQAEQLRSSLGELSLACIANAEEKMIYLRFPQLGLLEEELADSWLAWREEEYGWTFDLEDLTVGRLLYELALAGVNTVNDGYSGTSICVWRDLTDSAEQLAAVLGDGRFTHTEQGDVFTLDLDALSLEEAYASFPEWELTFTVADSGAITGSFQVQASGETLYELADGMACVCSGAFAFAPGESSLKLDLHLENLFRLELEATAAAGVSAADPAVAPPEGDAVVYIEDGVYPVE